MVLVVVVVVDQCSSHHALTIAPSRAAGCRVHSLFCTKWKRLNIDDDINYNIDNLFTKRYNTKQWNTAAYVCGRVAGY